MPARRGRTPASQPPQPPVVRYQHQGVRCAAGIVSEPVYRMQSADLIVRSLWEHLYVDPQDDPEARISGAGAPAQRRGRQVGTLPQACQQAREFAPVARLEAHRAAARRLYLDGGVTQAVRGKDRLRVVEYPRGVAAGWPGARSPCPCRAPASRRAESCTSVTPSTGAQRGAQLVDIDVAGRRFGQDPQCARGQ